MDLNVPECAMTNDCQVREVRAQYPPSRQDGQDGQDLGIVLGQYHEHFYSKFKIYDRTQTFQKWEIPIYDENILQILLLPYHFSLSFPSDKG